MAYTRSRNSYAILRSGEAPVFMDLSMDLIVSFR